MSGLKDHQDGGAVAAAVGCPSADALAAFASGEISEHDLITIASHVSQCDTCESAVRSLSGKEDSLASRLRAAVLHAAPVEDPACLRMQEAAKAIRPRRDESEITETELDAGSGESRAAAERQVTATAAWSQALPAMIGRYQVRSELGRGGFGSVYLAHDADLDRPVAIKVPRFDAEVSDERIRWFLHEARTAAKLKHPGIVAVYEVGRQDNSCHIVMEYVEGRSLSAEMAKGKLPLARAVEIVRDAATAVHYAHKKGLVHRDLKPGNILLDADGQVKIADFGLALHEDQQRSRAGELAGTLGYMSPEQVRRDVHRLDGRSDIWALGVILYELFAGRRPFAGTRDEVADEILHRSPKPPRQIDDTIPAELERICLKCLAKDPEQRYTSAGDVAAALERWSRPPTGPSRRPSSRWRWTVAALALAACVPLAYVTLNWRRGHQVPFDVDRVAVPHERVELMSRPPEVIFAPSSADETFEHRPRARQVHMDSMSTTLLGLGTTESRSFRIQMEIRKSMPVGCTGLVLGLKQLPPANGERQWECQVIAVNRRPQQPGLPRAPAFLEREVLLLGEAPSNTFSVRDRNSVANVRLDDAPLDRLSLEVTCRDGRIVEVRLGGTPYGQLVDPQRLSRWSIPNCYGRFGLSNSFGGATFSDARFESLPRTQP